MTPAGTTSDTDRAMAGTRDEVGGIDLNPELLDLQIRRDERGIPLPLFEQPLGEMNIQGFIPVIINVTPINNLPLLLGVTDGDDVDIFSQAGLDAAIKEI